MKMSVSVIFSLAENLERRFRGFAKQNVGILKFSSRVYLDLHL